MFQPSRKRMAMLHVAARDTARRHAKARKQASGKPAKKSKKKTKDLDDEEWGSDDETSDDGENMSDFEMAGHGGMDDSDNDAPDPEAYEATPEHSDGDGEISDNDNDPVNRPKRRPGSTQKGKARAASPDDLEQVRHELHTQPGLLAPCSVGSSGKARFEYLRHLSSHAEYQSLLQRWRSKVSNACRQRVRPVLTPSLHIVGDSGHRGASGRHALAVVVVRHPLSSRCYSRE